jgi:hypothetical protein
MESSIALFLNYLTFSFNTLPALKVGAFKAGM